MGSPAGHILRVVALSSGVAAVAIGVLIFNGALQVDFNALALFTYLTIVFAAGLWILLRR